MHLAQAREAKKPWTAIIRGKLLPLVLGFTSAALMWIRDNFLLRICCLFGNIRRWLAYRLTLDVWEAMTKIHPTFIESALNSATLLIQ
jgi:hypothetical protein